jgi:flavin-dependent dehydrogenase
VYDVIVVGARCAGSSLALLLARAGARVLVVDRATFPSETVNGHYIQDAGVRYLERWGVLESILGSGGAPIVERQFDFGPVAFRGRPTWPDGQSGIALAPRRRRLDALLGAAAAEAGAEVRTGFTVDGLLWEGGRVAGVRGRRSDGATVVERARIVVGADGFRSRVAAAVGATTYEAQPAQTCAYYSHWADLPLRHVEVYLRPGRYLLAFPTDDGLTCVAVGWPSREFALVRADVEGAFDAALDLAPDLAERVRAGRRVEPFRGMADLPTFLRTPFGPGWALVGDAGCRVDPITGQGITDAFRDASLLAEAMTASLGGGRPAEDALADYQRRRDAAVLPLYRYTFQRARLEPPSPELQRLLAALPGNQPEIDRFAGITAGIVAPSDFFSPENIGRILGAPPRAA